MPRSQIQTGQYVSITQTPASVGERILAQLIDWIILTVYITFMSIALGSFLYSSSYYSSDYELNLALFFIFVVGIPAFYFPVCELAFGGRSIGKMAMRIQVTMLDGSTPTIGAYLMRWLLYPLDVIITGGLGIIFILFSENNQRMGDLAAGTVVIKRTGSFQYKKLFEEFPNMGPNYKPTFPEAADLTLNQVDLISRTYYSPSPNRNEQVARLAQAIQRHLHIENRGMDPATFISIISNDYYYYASTIEVQ